MRLAADANVLLSALIGGKARLLLGKPVFEAVLTTETVLAEIHEYAAVLGRKRKIPEDQMLLGIAELPITIINRDSYAKALPEAKRRIGSRDADDVELLALAIAFKIPIWTNDRDFEQSGVLHHCPVVDEVLGSDPWLKHFRSGCCAKLTASSPWIRWPSKLGVTRPPLASRLPTSILQRAASNIPRLHNSRSS